jgi:hypothetical protein
MTSMSQIVPHLFIKMGFLIWTYKSYNKLPKRIKRLQSIILKKELKCLLLQNCFFTVEEYILAAL